MLRGIAGAAPLLALARLIPAAAAEPPGPRFLLADDVPLVRRIAAVVLEGALPGPAAADRRAAMDEVVAAVDHIIGAMSPGVRADLRDLFDLLAFAPTRIVLAGLWSDWPDASAADVAAFFEGWRTSRLTLLRAAYGALHDIVTGAWYGNPRSWPAIGYAGPPDLG